MLADILLQQKVVSPEVLDECRALCSREGGSLARRLLGRGAISEEVLQRVAVEYFKTPLVSLEGVSPEASVLKAVTARVAHHYGFMPMDWWGGALRAAFSYPPDLEELEEIRLTVGHEILPVLASAAEIMKALRIHYGIGADALEPAAGTAPLEIAPVPVEDDLEAAQDASVIKFVNQILLEAYRKRATDVHLEPYPDEFRLRYRIDGVLYETKAAESIKRFQAAVISRIKVMSDLSISEKRLPQDGRLKVRLEGQEMDLRVSTLPTPFGESVGLRLLTGRRFLDLPLLGYADNDLGALKSELDKPHGIILLTGPTGSGKTTTLYAFLNQINRAERKIITIEDPIEYQLRGITQVQVQPKIGLTFSQGLRAMLRHDPDVMMVGEIRDLETAEIAIRVALTGHLVFSTLHTNDAAGAVARLLDIGVEPYLIASSLSCVIAQRLVRLICPSCRRIVEAPPEALPELNEPFEPENALIARGAGCAQCHQTGFHGRTVIYEILPVSEGIRELIAQRVPAHKLREKALAEGMRTLRQCGWEKVRRELTTPEEVLRVTLEEDR